MRAGIGRVTLTPPSDRVNSDIVARRSDADRDPTGLLHLLPDHPGSLQRLTVLIADQKANIVETSHNRAYYGVNLGETLVDITMETKGADHVRELQQALNDGGYPHERVQ